MLQSKQYQGEHTLQTAPAIYHVNDLIRDYERTSSGHFFEKDTMRFFGSRVVEYFRGDQDTAFFITSEKNDALRDAKRLYTIRKVTRSASDSFYGYKYSITTHGDFQQFKSSAAAKKAIQLILGA